LCDWQVPLSWATLTLWSALSPTYIPCRVGYGTIDTRREAILESLRKAAKAVGGDVVVVEGLENQPEAHLRATLRYTFATGYAFRSIKPKS
jgi:hypothetical protein